jgi:hypothetical protein
MFDKDGAGDLEPTRLASALMLLGGFLFSGHLLPEIADSTLEDLRDLIDAEIALRRGMIH